MVHNPLQDLPHRKYLKCPLSAAQFKEYLLKNGCQSHQKYLVQAVLLVQVLLSQEFLQDPSKNRNTKTKKVPEAAF